MKKKKKRKIVKLKRVIQFLEISEKLTTNFSVRHPPNVFHSISVSIYGF